MLWWDTPALSERSSTVKRDTRAGTFPLSSCKSQNFVGVRGNCVAFQSPGCTTKRWRKCNACTRARRRETPKLRRTAALPKYTQLPNSGPFLSCWKRLLIGGQPSRGRPIKLQRDDFILRPPQVRIGCCRSRLSHPHVGKGEIPVRPLIGRGVVGGGSSVAERKRERPGRDKTGQERTPGKLMNMLMTCKWIQTSPPVRGFLRGTKSTFLHLRSCTLQSCRGEGTHSNSPAQPDGSGSFSIVDSPGYRKEGSPLRTTTPMEPARRHLGPQAVCFLKA